MNLNAISIENTVLREKALSVYACPTVRATRLKEENREKEFNVRPDFFRDADRILHSMAYTRYMDKTQVFAMVTNDLITHRGLHVQFVAKIARTIGRVLSLNEDLIEAIGLGHDLGHVPFGHFGERVLNKICEENGLGLFLHNAQSVRVLQTLENNGQGLNITVQVLDGILCHNGEMLEKKYEPDYKKTIPQFIEQYNNCWNIKGYDKKIRAMTLEGCVVRISDVIAYIGRDIEDAILLGLIKREDIPESITSVLGNTNAQIIDNLVKDLMEHSYGKSYLEFSDRVFEALKELMDFNYKNIYNNPVKSETEERSIKLFRMLYDKYVEDLENKRGYIYEEYYKKMSQTYTESNSYGKIVVDFIAGMTDKFFIEQFEDNFLPASM
jgi:dGTPase